MHVLDLAPLDGSDPLDNFETVERELALYQQRLADAAADPGAVQGRPGDAPSRVEQARAQWQERMGEEVPVLLTSSATRQGLDELATELLRRIPVLTRRRRQRRWWSADHRRRDSARRPP